MILITPRRLAPLLLLCLSALAFAASAQSVELLWYGQSAFRIATPGGKVVLIDPFITHNPVTPPALKDLAKLGQVDLILVTHGHGDHWGDTVEIAKQSGAPVGLNADLGNTVKALGLLPAEQLLRFNKSGTVTVAGVKVTMVRAEHSSTLIHTDATGAETVHPGGEPVGYVIELENGFKIYHAGDTGVFGDMQFIGEFYRPDLALLPIGGHFVMDPAHAADAVRYLLKVRRVIPMHYGTFPALKGTPEEFKQALGQTPVEVIVLNPGERKSF